MGALVVPEDFYHLADKNDYRKKAILRFVADDEKDLNIIQDKLSKRNLKQKRMSELRYDSPLNKCCRPFIISTEDSKTKGVEKPKKPLKISEEENIPLSN